MTESKELYLQALSAYLQHSNEPDSVSIPIEIVRLASIYSSVDLFELHRECLNVLTSKLPPEHALEVIGSSFEFVNRLLKGQDLTGFDAPSSSLLINKYESVLQNLDSGIALFNEDGYLSFINVKMARFVGVPRKELAGKHLFQIWKNKSIPGRLRKTILQLYREISTCRTSYHEIMTGNGQHLLITVTYDEELNGDILISAKDVTDYKRIEQAVYQNDKLAILGKISASIAHEIRNPLTSIRGFIQLLKPDLAVLGKEDYSNIILAEIDRANGIINEFLNSSKPTAPIKKRISALSLINEVTLLFESDALLNRCSIEYVPVDPGLMVSVDEKQMKQVLLNIVKNAIEAVSAREGQKGTVCLSAERDGPWIKMIIQDNGNGMDADTASRLFDPFFTTKEDGTGLGLSVSYRIIKNHGGKIDVRSKLGKGTTFSIRLPES